MLHIRHDAALAEAGAVFLRDALTGRFAQAAPGIGIHHLGSTRLSAWPIPIASVSEQRQIVAAIERQLSITDAMMAGVGRALRRSAALRRSILEQAFSGQLVLQDSSDEPASTLLEPVRARRDTAPAHHPGRRKVDA